MITSPEIRVTNNGKRFVLSRLGVENTMKEVAPQRVIKYGVVIHGQEYPVRQVLAVATRTPEIEWSTTNAYRLLQKLGFEILIH